MSDDKNRNPQQSKSANIEGVKDGFDLIEYPCDFAFKAMCKAQADVEEVPAEQHIRDIVLSVVSATQFIGLSTNQSRTGKFHSVTATVTLQNRRQLERIYQAISNSPRVVMTL